MVLLYYTNHTRQFSASNEFFFYIRVTGARSYSRMATKLLSFWCVVCVCSFHSLVSRVYFLNKEIKRAFMWRGAKCCYILIAYLVWKCAFDPPVFPYIYVCTTNIVRYTQTDLQSTSDLHIILMINDWKITINYTQAANAIHVCIQCNVPYFGFGTFFANRNVNHTWNARHKHRHFLSFLSLRVWKIHGSF